MMCFHCFKLTANITPIKIFGHVSSFDLIVELKEKCMPQ